MEHVEAVAIAQRALDDRAAGLRASPDPRNALVDADRFLIGYDTDVVGEPAISVDRHTGGVEFVQIQPWGSTFPWHTMRPVSAERAV